jgi:hypothetical protein
MCDILVSVNMLTMQPEISHWIKMQ